jgi:hypothetical protein
VLHSGDSFKLHFRAKSDVVVAYRHLRFGTDRKAAREAPFIALLEMATWPKRLLPSEVLVFTSGRLRCGSLMLDDFAMRFRVEIPDDAFARRLGHRTCRSSRRMTSVARA